MNRLAITICLAACGTEYSGPETPEPAGTDVYRESCQGCHGEAGVGTVGAPQLQSPVRSYASFVTKQGRGDEMGFGAVMPAYADEISDAQLEQVWSYLHAVPAATTGQARYVRFCGNCHGGDALGGRVGESLAGGADLVADDENELFEKVRDGHGGTSYGNREKYMPGWTQSELSDAEVESIGAYLATLTPGPDDND